MFYQQMLTEYDKVLMVLLHRLGIRGNPWTLINNSLSNRKAIPQDFIKGDEFIVQLSSVKITKLGLFSLFIIDMMVNTLGSNCKFADDGTICHMCPARFERTEIKDKSREVLDCLDKEMENKCQREKS